MLGMVVSFNNCLKRTYRKSCDQIINDILTGSGAKCKKLRTYEMEIFTAESVRTISLFSGKSEKPNAVKTVPSGLPVKTGKGKSKKTTKGGKSY